MWVVKVPLLKDGWDDLGGHGRWPRHCPPHLTLLPTLICSSASSSWPCTMRSCSTAGTPSGAGFEAMGEG